jgi:hypothetical protein
MDWIGWSADGDLSTWVCTVPCMMDTLKIVMRLRWVIALTALGIAFVTFKPAAYMISAVLCCAAPLDLMMALLPSGRRRTDRVRRAAVKQESRRLIDQA